MRIYLLKRKSKLSKESEAQGKSKKISLYLMYHFPGQKKREYEWLNLYLFEKPKNQIERDHNKSTQFLAETIKAKRVVDSQTSEHGFISKVRSRICFLAFFKKLTEKKQDSNGNYGNWKSTYEHLLKYTYGRELPMDRIDERWLEGFKEYLTTCTTIKGNRQVEKLNKNSASSYFNKVRAALREAYNQRMIRENPAARVKCIKGQDSHREFLALEEIQKLAKTPSDVPTLSRMFLFSCTCGLRFSDMKNLRWENIRYSEQSGWYIQFTVKKTKMAAILPIAEHTIKILGNRGEESEHVFKNVIYNTYNNQRLVRWIKSAGINKKISMHNARHSYACLHLSLGTDIFTVSKLLGHANLKTTQIYSKVHSDKLIAAAVKIPKIFDSF
jgi:integrase